MGNVILSIDNFTIFGNDRDIKKAFAHKRKEISIMGDTIMIIDDDTDICKLLVPYLSQHGFEAISCSYSSQAAVSIIHSKDPDLIILDVSMPSLAGLDVCTELRKFSDKPILFTSQYTEDYLRIDALNRGGDEYVVKPFSFDILLAQVKAHIRRYKRAFPVNQRHLFIFPGLEIDLLAHSVKSHGKEAILSTKEFQLLVILAKNPNRVFRTEALYDLIWNDNKQGDIRTVMVHIYNLRQKIEKKPREPRYIHTVRGAGYKFKG